MEAETIFFQLTLASPVHIGCDEVYEPMGFVVDLENKELVSFKPEDFIARLTDNELAKYSAICRKGTVESIQELYKFMQAHYQLAMGTRIAISPGFARHYKEVLDKPGRQFKGELNKFEINRTAFNPMYDLPVIPGSSLKGAIRTAVLNWRNKGASEPKYGNSKALEKNLLGGDFAGDPFSRIKVSDFMPIGVPARYIGYAVNAKKKPNDREASAMAQMQEMVKPGSSFLGSITILPPHGNIKKPISKAEMMEALKYFYGQEQEREEGELKNIGVQFSPLCPSAANCFPLRLGRHSGAECVTVRGHRNIRIMQGKGNTPKFEDHATTIWLASPSRRPNNMDNLQPMGWVIMEELTSDAVARLKQEQHELRLEWEKKYRQQLLEIKKQEELRRQQEEEKERLRRKQQEEEAARKAREEELAKQWQGMSELEQDIAIVLGKEVALSQAANKDAMRDIWPKIERYEGEEQKDLARSFVALWRDNPKKWRRKESSGSQWQKIEQLVTILAMEHPDIQYLSEEEQKELALITGLKDWGQYKNSGIEIDKLSLSQAKALEKKFKQFGCDKKKVKKDKQNAWKKLQNHIKQLRKSDQ